MDRVWTRRWLIVLSSPLILFIFLRKTWVQLALSAVLYANAESWLSVTPFSFDELVNFFSSRVEAAIGFVGLVVAFAAGRGFVESKQLDLKLAFEAEMGELASDASKSIQTCRMAAESMVSVESMAAPIVVQAQESGAGRVVFPTRVEGAYHMLLYKARGLRDAQESLGPLLGRFRDSERKWAPLIRSNLITSIALSKAKDALASISDAASLLEVDQNWMIEEFLVMQEGHWGTRPEEFVRVVRANENKFHGWMGAASGMGSSSIFRPSVLITAQLWWQLFRMRE